MKQTIGDYFSGASDDLKKNGKSMLILLAVTVLPVQGLLLIVNEMLGTKVSDSGLGFIFSSIGFLNILLAVAWVLFFAGFLLLLSKDVKADDYKKAFKNGLPRFWPMFGVTIFIALIIAAGFFLLVLPGIYFGVALMYAAIVVVLEKKGVFESIGRSFELVRKRWWKTLVRLLPVISLFFIWGLVSPYIPSVVIITDSIEYIVMDILQIIAVVWGYRMYLDAKKTVVKK